MGSDNMVKDANWFWFIPPWYLDHAHELAALANGERRPYAPLLVHDEQAPLPLPDTTHAVPATPQWEGPSGWEPSPDEVPEVPNWEEVFRMYQVLLRGLHFLNHIVDVDATWLDHDLRQLPLFVCMADGSRAYSKTVQGAMGKLVAQPVSQSNTGDQVDVNLLGAQAQFLRNIHIKHLLPKHPEHKNEYAAFISGTRKSEIVRVTQVDGDSVVVQQLGKGAHKKPTTSHPKYELASCQLHPKKK